MVSTWEFALNVFCCFLYFTEDFGKIIEEMWTDAIFQYLRQLEEEEDEKHNEDGEIHFQRSLKRKHE
jgi:hypothetical protein